MIFVEGLLVEQDEWDKLDELQKQFIREAEDGHFRYQAVDGRVCAWGAAKTDNLFSMTVRETVLPEESVYTLLDPKYT